MTPPPGVILAGGLSRRMGGGDKALLSLSGRPILSHALDRLRPQAGAIALNANGDPGRFADWDLPVIADSIPDFAGPLAGVLAGLDWAADLGAAHIVTVAADTPFFPPDLTVRLIGAAEARKTPLARAATPDETRGLNRHHVFGLWSVALRDDLRAALTGGLRKIVLWTDAKGCAEVVWPTDPFDPFFNINRPEDLDAAARYARMGA